MKEPFAFTIAQIRRIAVAAEADPRTVARFLRGEPVRGMVRERIERAVETTAAERVREAESERARKEQIIRKLAKTKTPPLGEDWIQRALAEIG